MLVIAFDAATMFALRTASRSPSAEILTPAAVSIRAVSGESSRSYPVT